ncbi:hypothetical protein HDV02_005116 [Globomyces sp. JEL0801]|nr:hypothetical protein HDV02_005116 [Globomyces sp. JEL0801]
MSTPRQKSAGNRNISFQQPTNVNNKKILSSINKSNPIGKSQVLHGSERVQIPNQKRPPSGKMIGSQKDTRPASGKMNVGQKDTRPASGKITGIQKDTRPASGKMNVNQNEHNKSKKILEHKRKEDIPNSKVTFNNSSETSAKLQKMPTKRFSTTQAYEEKDSTTVAMPAQADTSNTVSKSAHHFKSIANKFKLLSRFKLASSAANLDANGIQSNTQQKETNRSSIFIDKSSYEMSYQNQLENNNKSDHFGTNMSNSEQKIDKPMDDPLATLWIRTGNGKMELMDLLSQQAAKSADPHPTPKPKSRKSKGRRKSLKHSADIKVANKSKKLPDVVPSAPPDPILAALQTTALNPLEELTMTAGIRITWESDELPEEPSTILPEVLPQVNSDPILAMPSTTFTMLPSFIAKVKKETVVPQVKRFNIKHQKTTLQSA